MKIKTILALSSIMLVSGCSLLPTTGPSKDAIITQLPQRVNIVNVDLPLAQQMSSSTVSQQLSTLTNKGSFNGEVNEGDILSVYIWEAPPAVLFGVTSPEIGQGNSKLVKLPEQMVNKRGRITVPFVGSVFVKGKTPEQIQNQLVNSLRNKANQPQVIVRVTQNNSANVSIIREGGSIRMPLTTYGERILDAVAAVGGTPNNIQEVTVQLTRKNAVKTIPLESLIKEPAQNIPLRSGDVLALLDKPSSFTGLGALGTNRQVKFPTKGLNLAEAIGKMGGLIDTRSDPRGIFVFRYMPLNTLPDAKQQQWYKQGYSTDTEIPTVYNIDLSKPQSFFILQKFPIQDKDIVYVSNAPLAEFNKFLRMVFSTSISTARSVKSVTAN
ncbi:polysaccharide export protein Wza [Phocoenobacter uteri]|uniref:Polysaccharide export protein Wza n=1 Tax=Phocoenobacter uteri TaxID=146806 RepID=A0A379CAP3_9PAST|nr:polysaccharide biosynthesis/export family protein [Phocoenobacter uteri]MDG6881300.1 sugar ABC transporter substrate-binding protein [Phocoenobacter uteri]SUB59324.1 polysaccharide export protein Wza [Phocoenobacter uteri]